MRDLLQLPRPEPLPFVDTAPTWLGPSLMLFGVAALVLWGVARILPRIPLIKHKKQQLVLLFLIVLGTTFTTAGALGVSRTLSTAALGLFAAGRFIEGGAAVRGFRKIIYLLRNQSLPSDRKKLTQKVRYIAIRVSIGLITTIFLYGIFLLNARSPPLFILTLVWTFGTFMLAVIGLSWKLGSAEEELPAPVITGLLATFSGATVYDYVTLAGDVTHILVGAVAFLIGTAVGIVAFLTR